MKYFSLLIFCMVIFSCKTKQPAVVPPAEYKEKIVERMVTYQVPADSTQLYALLACDSLNNVILKEYSEYKSKGIESQFSLSQNRLSYNTYKQSDTVYVKVADTTRVSKIPYAVEVPVKINELTKFQSFQIRVAWIAETIILCLVVFGVVRYKNILKIKK